MKARLAAIAARLRALLRKEFLQLLRDPRMRFVLIAPPMIQLIVFGYAATFDVRHADLAVVDFGRDRASRDLLAAIEATGHYTLRMLPDMRAAAAAMDRGDARVIMQIPARFSRSNQVQLIADGSDPNSAQLIVSEIGRIIAQSAAARSGAGPPITVEERAWFNPNLEDRWFFVPGIMANVIFLSTMMLTAMLVVREREFGTLERLMVTPVARVEYLLCKMVPVACVGLFDALLIAAVAVLWFDLPFRGSVLTLVSATLVLMISTQGLGLLMSTLAATQQQAMLSAAFFLMPMIILSGFAFPIRNMPAAMQWLSLIDPLRYYLVVNRDLFLQGEGGSAHLFEYGMMALLGVVPLSLAALRLR
ncbi:MAG TPA: ABC transporter permease [Burkholderiaceae bacterium]